MFSDPFTYPAMGPPERGWAEWAALPQGRWEEAPARGGRKPLGFGSEHHACGGVSRRGDSARSPGALPCRWLADARGRVVSAWRGPQAARGAGRVAFCFVSVMARPLTTRAGWVVVQEHPPRQLPELWPPCPCGSPRRVPGKCECQPPPTAHTQVLRDAAGKGAAPHPPGQGLLLTGLTLLPRSR